MQQYITGSEAALDAVLAKTKIEELSLQLYTKYRRNFENPCFTFYYQYENEYGIGSEGATFYCAISNLERDEYNEEYAQFSWLKREVALLGLEYEILPIDANLQYRINIG